MADVTRLVGIDFGTSTSVVCVKRYKDGEPLGGAFLSSAVTFGDGQGDNKAHTVVRRNADGTYTCGRPAEDAGPETQVFREFKMDLENPDGAKSAQAKALTEEFFKYLYRWYDHQRSNLGEAGDQEKTIVSFPAKWTEETRSFMVEAARKAGFPDVSAMDEPSAALYASLTQNMNDVSAKGLLRAGEPGYMLLVDMGAGTTDLAVCRYTVDAGASGVIRADQIKNEIVSTWPEAAGAPTFGGREVDRLLEDYLTDYMTSCGLDPAMARQLVCGTASVKPWKETVVSPRLNEGNIVDSCGFLSGYMMLLPKKQPFPAIDRAKLEELLKDKLNDFKSLVTGCLDKASQLEPAIAENGVDLVVLTGGHSAWYFTEELLNGTIPGLTHTALKRAQSEPSRVLRLSNPQETVALGLVYSLLPLKTERETKKEAARYVNEANTTYAFTPHHREVIKRGTDTIKKVEETRTEKQENRVSGEPASILEKGLLFMDSWEGLDWISGNEPRSAFRGTLRWTLGYEEAGVAVDEKGIRFNYTRSNTFQQVDYKLAWDIFLSAQVQTLFNTLYLKLPKEGLKPLLERYESDDLGTSMFSFVLILRQFLSGQSLWKPVGPEKKRDHSAGNISESREFKDDVRGFILTHRDKLRTEFDPSKAERFRMYLKIPASTEILLQHMAPTMFQSNYGKDGWAFTPEGIYRRSGGNSFVRWSEFAEKQVQITRYSYRLYPLTDFYVPLKPDNMQRWAEALDFFLALRTYVRGLMGMD